MEYLTGKIMMVETLVEVPLVKAGFLKLIHDGNADGSLVFSKQYEIYLDGKTTGSKVKFVYNTREDWAEVSMSPFAVYNLKLVERITRGEINEQEARIQMDEAKRYYDIRPKNERAWGRGYLQK